MQSIDTQVLESLARRYMWWQTPAESARMPQRVIAQVMDIGDYADVEVLAAQVGETTLREVLRSAQPGQLRPRSWAYWHYRLGLSRVGQVPPLPTRHFG